MNLSELCTALDDYFNIAAFVETDWAELMSEADRGAIQRFLLPEFADGLWNGLMLDNATEDEEIDRIYLAVFPSQDVLDIIIAHEVERGAPGALVFTHHPLAYSEMVSAFRTIPTVQLEEFQEHRISLYSCHAPLDCHPETSTANALADALGLEEQVRFGQYYAGQAGIAGKVTPTTFQAFADKLAEICELPQLRYDQCLNNGQVVEHIAITPGGGGDPEFIDKAVALGADTYVTGHWWLFGEGDYAAHNRQEMSSYIPLLKLNLLASSHYSSELIVMRDQMPDWFKQFNIETMVVRQENAWG